MVVATASEGTRLGVRSHCLAAPKMAQLVAEAWISGETGDGVG